MTAEPQSPAVLPPPTERIEALRWLRQNLFSSWYSALLTLVAIWLIYSIAVPTLQWVFTEARWGVISANFRLLMVGQYPTIKPNADFPTDQIWRIYACLVLLVIFIALSFFGRYDKLIRRIANIAWVCYIPLIIFIVAGFTYKDGILPTVSSNMWGGLLLTLLLTAVGIMVSFPLGILLALGRRSTLPVIRWFCTAYIELIRGVPLITVLFMANLMLPLFLPANWAPTSIVRAMAGVSLFSAAYVAENVRGGLQAINKGQFEAASALGMNYVQALRFIILPQALKLVVPILIGQFIGVFKDTSLVAIVGLFDFLGIGNSIKAQPEFIGTSKEVYLVIAAVYWVLSWILARYVKRYEIKT